MSGELAVDIIACAVLEAGNRSVRGGLYDHEADAIAAHVVSVLAASGHTIVAHSEILEMIGPSREVDNCPKCGETVTWEKSAYDMRDNDDHRYSWVAYCEVCKLDLELTPDPNPPIAAAEEDQ